MSELLQDLIVDRIQRFADNNALVFKKRTISYAQLFNLVKGASNGFLALGLQHHDRVAVFLPKVPEAVAAIFAAANAGGIFVPINPLLKPAQVAHILMDSGARLLITSRNRAAQLQSVIEKCPDLFCVILTENIKDSSLKCAGKCVLTWQEVLQLNKHPSRFSVIDTDIVALLYTSGSTGPPKGVALSHKNMVIGARSVVEYLRNDSSDKILAVLPLSFDYGFSQLTTAFLAGACCVLMDYFSPSEVLKQVIDEEITGLAAVPPLWMQLAHYQWPQQAVDSLRYLTNSGGALPVATVNILRKSLPKTKLYLMYGLTEAFRSTYLPPEELDRRPDSIGKAIPNAEIMVLRPDGSQCSPDEPGELVHKGPLVACCYWKNEADTKKRFRPINKGSSSIENDELVVWSGDTVKIDKEGFIYFISRNDEMIKTSGYRVSPTDIEEIIYATGFVKEVVVVGLPHPTLGQAIAAVVVPLEQRLNEEMILQACKKYLPRFMLPEYIKICSALPRNHNGKIDRLLIKEELSLLSN